MGNVRRARRGSNDALNAKVEDSSGTPATLSHEAVQKVIRQNLAGVRACFLRVGRDGNQRSGKAIVSFEIGAGRRRSRHQGRRARVPGDVAARLRAGHGVALGVPEVAEGRAGDQLPVRVRRRLSGRGRLRRLAFVLVASAACVRCGGGAAAPPDGRRGWQRRRRRVGRVRRHGPRWPGGRAGGTPAPAGTGGAARRRASAASRPPRTPACRGRRADGRQRRRDA